MLSLLAGFPLIPQLSPIMFNIKHLWIPGPHAASSKQRSAGSNFGGKKKALPPRCPVSRPPLLCKKEANSFAHCTGTWSHYFDCRVAALQIPTLLRFAHSLPTTGSFDLQNCHVKQARFVGHSVPLETYSMGLLPLPLNETWACQISRICRWLNATRNLFCAAPSSSALEWNLGRPPDFSVTFR